MIDSPYGLRSQETTKQHPVGWGFGQRDSQRFCGRDAFEFGTGFKDVVVDDLSFDERGQSQVTFETAEGSGSGFEIGPFSFEGVVVGVLEERFVDQVLFGVDAEVLEGADVTPESVGEDVGFAHFGGGVIGHGEGVACGLGVASGGEVVTEVGVISRDIDEPEPAFFAHALELGFVGEESGFSAAFFGDDGQLAAFVGQQEGGFVTPACDGVVGDLEAIEVAESVGDGRGGHGAEEREVEGQGDGGGRELHPVPMEKELDLATDEADVFRVHHEVEGFIPGQGDVDLVRAAMVSFCVMPVAAESQGIAEVLEDAHGRATFGANDLRILRDSAWAVRDKLSPTSGGFAAIPLQPPVRITTEAIDLPAAPGTPNIQATFRHTNLLSDRGVRF
jgi:hypothetical protein